MNRPYPIEYELFEYATDAVITNALLGRTTKVERFLELGMKRTLYVRVMGRRLKKVTFPATWWDAVLARWAPRWRWLPAWLVPKYTVVEGLAFYMGMSPDETASSETYPSVALKDLIMKREP